jgi:hypothetical protein
MRLKHSGSLLGLQKRRGVIEKEAFPIIEASERLRHSLMRKKTFTISKDHRNLVTVFEPDSRRTDFKKHTVTNFVAGLQNSIVSHTSSNIFVENQMCGQTNFPHGKQEILKESCQCLQ